jgi:predicted ATPase/DNA-binding SARP family transcriptional activator
MAILATLAVSGEPQTRASLLARLWPDYDDSSGRTNLRRDLSYLRRTVGSEHFIADRNQVQLDLAAGLWVDVHHFQALLTEADAHNHDDRPLCNRCLAALMEAAGLYRGELLAGFSLADAPTFDEWLFFERDSLRNQVATIWQRLARHRGRMAEFDTATDDARHWLALDSLHEPAHRLLMRLYAWSGQQAAALRQYETCRQLLQEELDVAPDPETIALFEAIKARQLSPPVPVPAPEASTPASLQKTIATDVVPEQANIPHNLPSQPTPFIGRESELAALDELLVDPDKRLVTIVGAGGMGKTRLALAAAERQLDGGGSIGVGPTHGVYFVALAPLSSVDHIVPAMAEALDFPMDSGGQQTRTPRRQILDYLRRKQMLIVMDNFEHLLDGAEIVTDILGAAPGVQVLASSRERLHLNQEQIFAIEGLEFPDWETPQEAATYSAVRLFIQSAQRIQHDFALAADDLTYLSRICRLVGGLPLAVELAAGWVDMLSLADIAAEIQKSLGFLESEIRDVVARHQSMRAVFDASWQRMSAAEQQIFPQLSVFRGGFTRRAGQEVTGASLRQLGQVVSKSLLQYDRSRDRYQIHGLLRQYGAEKMAEDKELDTSVHDRHSAYYCAALQEREGELKGVRQQEALAEIEVDFENCRAAWNWAVAERHVEEVEPAIECLGYFFEWQGRYQEGGTAFRILVAALEDTPSSYDRLVLAKALAWRSVFEQVLGKTDAAKASLEQSVKLLDECGLMSPVASSCRAFALLQLGHLAHKADITEARPLYEKSLALYRELGQQWETAIVLAALGYVVGAVGDYDEAQALQKEALEIQQALGDKRSAAYILASMSTWARYQRRGAESERLAHESVVMARAANNRTVLAQSLKNLGMSCAFLGQYERQCAYLAESVALSEELGDADRLPDAFFGLSVAHGNLGQYEQGRSVAQKGLTLTQETGRNHITAMLLWNLGMMRVAQGDFAQAKQKLQESLKFFEISGKRTEMTFALGSLGLAEHGLGNSDRARQYVYDALQMVRGTPDHISFLLLIPQAALLLSDQGKVELAIELWVSASQQPFASAATNRDLYDHHITTAVASLPPNAAAAAQARGRELDLREAAEKLLSELAELGWGADTEAN